MKIEMSNLAQPKTNTQEILFTLIKHGSVSIFDFPYLSGFRTRVSELVLTHELVLDKEMKTHINKFGNTYNYALHKLPESEREKAVNLYLKLKNHA